MRISPKALQYRQHMSALLRHQAGKVVLPESADLTRIEQMWNELSEEEQEEADAYISALATGELSLEDFKRQTENVGCNNLVTATFHSSSIDLVVVSGGTHIARLYGFGSVAPSRALAGIDFELRDLEPTIEIDDYVIRAGSSNYYYIGSFSTKIEDFDLAGDGDTKLYEISPISDIYQTYSWEQLDGRRVLN
jgi:hypothetical protein